MEPSPDLHGHGAGEFGEWQNRDKEIERKELGSAIVLTIRQYYHLIDSRFDDLGWEENIPRYSNKMKASRDIRIDNPICHNIKRGSELFQLDLRYLEVNRRIKRELIEEVGSSETKTIDTLLIGLATHKKAGQLRAILAWTQRIKGEKETVFKLYLREGAEMVDAGGFFKNLRDARIEAQCLNDDISNIQIDGDTDLLVVDWANLITILQTNLFDHRISQRHAQSE